MATPTTIDARPATVNLMMYAGDDLNLQVAVTDSGGAAVDLTGYTAKAQIRATADAATSVDFDATVPAPATGIIVLDLLSVDSTGLPAKGVWDVEVSSASGVVTTLATGTVTVTPEVSR